MVIVRFMDARLKTRWSWCKTCGAEPLGCAAVGRPSRTDRKARWMGLRCWVSSISRQVVSLMIRDTRRRSDTMPVRWTPAVAGPRPVGSGLFSMRAWTAS